METIRRSNERGVAEHGWLSSRHTFSFANYYDPRFIGYRDLLVINEDRVQPGRGFGTHGHRDMEIISYVLEGALEHADSMGTGSVIKPGDVQRMSAGTGVHHSEYNHSRTQPVHFLQIWIQPDRDNLRPSYEQKTFDDAEKLNRLRLIASPDGREGSVTIHQDASLYASVLEPGAEVNFEIAPGRHVWLQVATGQVVANDETLSAGDAMALHEVPVLKVRGVERGEILVFDLK